MSFAAKELVVDRGLRTALIALACAGALGSLTKSTKGEPNDHAYIKLFHRDVLLNMADEATECIVYFSIAAKTLMDTSEPNLGSAYDAASKKSLDWALQLTQWAGLKHETVWTNLKFA